MIEENKNYLLKAIMGQYEYKIYVQLFSSKNTNYLWFIFDFQYFKSTDVEFGSSCFTGTKLINFQYFKSTNHYLSSCNETNGIALSRKIYSENNELEIHNSIIEYIECLYYINYDIIFLPFEGKYILISNFICNNNTQLYNFPYSLYAFDYEIPSDEPDSEQFFSNYTETEVLTTIPNIIPSMIPNVIPSTNPNVISSIIPNIITTTIQNIITTTIQNTITTIIPNIITTTIPNIFSNMILKSDILPSTFVLLNCENKNLYYNYEKTECIETIPDGFYCNNKELKTIEKCHDNCKTCEMGPTTDNNNCLTCKDSKYFNLGNCVTESECINGIFIDDNNIEKCKCTTNIECKDCNETSNSYSQCLSCNVDEGYYPLNNSESNIFPYFNCIKNEISQINKTLNITLEDCPENFPYLLKDEKKCVNSCNTSDLFNEECMINNQNILLKENISNDIRNSITSNKISSLLDKVLNNSQDLLIDYKNIKYQITSTFNQINNEYNNISTINLGKCENILKNVYNISEDDPLLIFKGDSYIEGVLIPVVMYEVYHPKTKKKLDLNHCEDTQITINLPCSVDENELFKHDPSNEFYNDICSSYTQNGCDITLKDRQNEFINNNYTLCEDGCSFNGYEAKAKKVECNCNIKKAMPKASEIKIDREKLKNNFINIKRIINLDIMKCYKKLFTKEGLLKNVSSYILLSIIFIHILLFILFILKECDIIKRKINSICLFKKKFRTNNKQNKNKEQKIDKKNKAEKKKVIKLKNKKINIIQNYIINQYSKNGNDTKYPPKKKIAKVKTKYNKNNKDKINMNKSTSKSKINLRNSISDSRNINNLITINNEDNFNPNKNKNNKKIKNTIMKYTDYELNSMTFKNALAYDKRSYIQYYLSLLRTKHILISAIMPSYDYNSRISKIYLFLFSFALYYCINALFFINNTVHDIS